jgi:hypothetical protein
MALERICIVLILDLRPLNQRCYKIYHNAKPTRPRFSASINRFKIPQKDALARLLRWTFEDYLRPCKGFSTHRMVYTATANDRTLLLTAPERRKDSPFGG